jgi:hypothetical protein
MLIVEEEHIDARSVILQHLAGRRLSKDLTLYVNLVPAHPHKVEFSTRLVKDSDHSFSTSEAFTGFYVLGVGDESKASIEGHYFEDVSFPNGQVSMSQEGLGVRLFEILGELIPSGGSLAITYSSLVRVGSIYERTDRAVRREYPLVVTALGNLLFLAGCSTNLRHSSSSEIGHEVWKMQGFKPLTAEEMRRAGVGLIREMHQFVARQSEEDELARQCRLLAFTIIERAHKTQ